VRRVLTQVVYHLALASGAIIFSMPFFWLASSSLKQRDELFATPPKWLPGLPVQVTASPYLHVPTAPDPPDELDENVWRELEPELYQRSGEAILATGHPGVAAVHPHTPELLQVLSVETVQTVFTRAGADVALKRPGEIVDELCRRQSLGRGEVDGLWQTHVDAVLARTDQGVAGLADAGLSASGESGAEHDLWLAAWARGARVSGGYEWEERLQRKFARPEVWEAFTYRLGALLWHRLRDTRGEYAKQRTGPEMVGFVCEQIDVELVDRAWSRIYRTVLFGDLILEFEDGTQVPLAELGSSSSLPGATPQLGLGAQLTAQERPGRQVRYSFDEGKLLSATFELDHSVDPDRIRRFVLPIRGDRSWHDVRLSVNTGAASYRAADPFVLGNDRWMDAIWVFGEPSLREKLTTFHSADLTPLIETAEELVGGPAVTLEFTHTSYGRVLLRRFVRNYSGALLAIPFTQYLTNTLILVSLNITSQLFACSLIAYGFARMRWPGRDIVFGVVLATMMLPAQVTMIPQFLIWRGLGQYDTFQPLWLPSLFGSGFFIFLMRQFMLSIPKELEDAACIDGCGFFRTYWHIILPLLKPALAAVCIFQFMGTWNDFLGPLIYISSESKAPLSLGLFRFQGSAFLGTSGEMGMLMAASLLMTLPIILLFFLAQRYFIQGITFTGIKN